MRCFLLTLALLAGPAAAADYFGAIAYSPKTGADGWAKDHPSREAAERAALEACRKHAHDCRPVFYFWNTCAALATSPSTYAWGWAENQTAADLEAMKACAKHAAGCKVIRQVCTSRAGGPGAKPGKAAQ